MIGYFFLCQRLQEIELFRVVVEKFVLSLILFEISIDITLISQQGPGKKSELGFIKYSPIKPPGAFFHEMVTARDQPKPFLQIPAVESPGVFTES